MLFKLEMETAMWVIIERKRKSLYNLNPKMKILMLNLLISLSVNDILIK